MRRGRNTCCSRPKPTRTSPSRRSTTSASTTTCSSRGTLRRNGCSPSSTTCSATGGANPDHTSDVQVVGHRWSDRSHDIKMFLARNYVPYRWYDVERDAEAQRLRDLAHATPADLPL